MNSGYVFRYRERPKVKYFNFRKFFIFTAFGRILLQHPPEYVEAVDQFGHVFDGPECREVITGFVSSLAGKETPKDITGYAMSVMPEENNHSTK